MNYPHLPNAPIHEAIIDLWTEPRADLDEETLRGLVADRFPEFSKTRTGYRVDISVQTKTTSTEVEGFIVEDEKHQLTLHVRRNGFSVSKIKPYADWATFKAQAQELWVRYLDALHPKTVVRLGLRYINHLTFDLSSGLEQIVQLALVVPTPAAPEGITSLTTSYTSEFPDSEASARVVFHIPTVQPGTTTALAILDIDAFRKIDSVATEESIWDRLDELVEVKNRVFFSLLAEEAVERYREP